MKVFETNGSRHGIMVWEETLGPGTSTADLNNPYFLK